MSQLSFGDAAVVTGEKRSPVTVIGLGPMGQALAGAFLKNGHPTTVWNRSAGKAEALVAQGAMHDLFFQPMLHRLQRTHLSVDLIQLLLIHFQHFITKFILLGTVILATQDFLNFIGSQTQPQVELDNSDPFNGSFIIGC